MPKDQRCGSKQETNGRVQQQRERSSAKTDYE